MTRVRGFLFLFLYFIKILFKICHDTKFFVENYAWYVVCTVWEKRQKEINVSRKNNSLLQVH